MLDAGIRKRITDVIIPGYLSDCVKARVLGSDGVYTRAVCPPGQEPCRRSSTSATSPASRLLRVEPKNEKLQVATKPASKGSEHQTTRLPSEELDLQLKIHLYGPSRHLTSQRV